MAWNYSGNPADSDLDATRFEIGDTLEDEPLLDDAEIEYLLDEENDSVLRAAARGCEHLASRFAREANVTVGSLRVQLADRSEAFRQRAIALRQKASSLTARPYSAESSERDPIFTIDKFTYNGERSIR